MGISLLCGLMLALACVSHSTVVKRQSPVPAHFRRPTLEEIMEPGEITDPRLAAQRLRSLGLQTRNLWEDPLEPPEISDGGGLALVLARMAAENRSQRRGSSRQGSALGHMNAVVNQGRGSTGGSQSSSFSSAQSRESVPTASNVQQKSATSQVIPRGSSNSLQEAPANLNVLLPDIQTLLDSMSPPLAKYPTFPTNRHAVSSKTEVNPTNTQTGTQGSPQSRSANPEPRTNRAQWDPVNPQPRSSSQYSWVGSGVNWFDTLQAPQGPSGLRKASTALHQGTVGEQRGPAISTQGLANGRQESPNTQQIYTNAYQANLQQGSLRLPQESAIVIADQMNQRQDGPSQRRAPLNAPQAAADPITFVDNLPTANLKVQLDFDVPTNKPSGSSNLPAEQNIPQAGQSKSQTGSGTFQRGSSRARGGSNFLNQLQNAFANSINIVDNPQNRKPNPTTIRDALAGSQAQNGVLVNPADPNAPSAPANAPLDEPQTTPGFRRPGSGKSSVLVIPGSQLGKKVYTNP